MAGYRQSSFLGGVLAPALFGRTDLAKYPHSLRELRNFVPKQEGSAINRAGFIWKSQTYTGGAARLIPFVFSRDKSYVLEFTNLKLRIYKAGVVVKDNITSPFATADLPYIKWSQVGSTMTLCRDGFDPREIAYTGPTDADWTAITSVSRLTSESPPDWLATGIAASIPDAYAAGTDDAHPKKMWEWAITYVGPGENADESIPLVSSAVATARVVFTDRTQEVNWQHSPSRHNIGSDYGHYNIYRGRNGRFGFIGTVPATKTVFYDDGLYPVYSDPPPSNRDPFAAPSSGRMQPQVVTHHQQRSVFANTYNDPPGIWSSKLGRLKDFNTAEPPKDSDPVTIGLAAKKFEEVRSMLSAGNLLVFTNAGEWAIVSETAFTPNAIGAVPISFWGSAWLDPVQIGNSILFVQEKGNQIREIIFGGGGEVGGGDDLTLLASHLFDTYTISDWCYQEVPFRTLWCVRSDGKLLSCTYVKQSQIVAWAWHDNAAFTFENVCTVPEGTEDVVYAIANLGGTRHLLRMAYREQPQLKLCNLLDFSKVTVNGSPSTTAPVATALAGRSDIYALADGVVQGPFTYNAGNVTLPIAATNVVTGLKFTSELETLDLHNKEAEVRTSEKIVRKVFFEVVNSAPFQVGETLTGSLLTSSMPTVDANGYSQGLVETLPNVTWNRNGRACVRQTDPLPVNILSLIREVDHGGV